MRRILAFAMLIAAACADGTAPKSDLLQIHVLPDALHIVNTSPQSVYVFVAERNTLALLDWAPCSDPTTCEGIAVGGSQLLPFAEITGYTVDATEVVVHHWHLVSNGAGGFRPDSIRATIVALDGHHH